MGDELKDIVTKMVAAGESEDNIALVIKNYKPKEVAPVAPKPQPTMNKFHDLAGRVDRGFVDVIASIPEGIGAMAKGLNRYTGFDDPNKPVEEYALSKLGKGIRNAANSVIETDPARDEEFTSKVATGLGSAAAFALTLGKGGVASTAEQVAGRTAGVIAKDALVGAGKALVSPTAVVGGIVGGKGAFDEAKQAGLSDDDAFDVYLKNFPAGMTEAIPFTNIAKRFNTITGGGLVNYLKQAVTGGLEEGIQEALQKYWSNIVAKGSFDPERDPMMGLAEEGGVAFTVGLLIPSVLNAPGLAKDVKNQIVSKLKSTAQAKVGLEPTEALAPEAKSVIDTDTKDIIEEIVKPSESQASAEDILPPSSDVLDTSTPESTFQETPVTNPKEAEVTTPPVDLSPLQQAHTAAYEAWNQDQSEENAVALQKATQELSQAVTELKPSKKNPWQDSIKAIETSKDEEEMLSKARLLINEFPAQSRQLTAALINGTGKNRTKTSFGQFIAALNDAAGVAKRVVTTEKAQFRDQIKNFGRGVRAGRIDEKSDRVNMIATLKDIIGKQKLPAKVHKAIMNKLGSIEFRNTDKVVALADYVDRVTKDATYADQMEEIETLKDKVKSSYKNKLPVKQHNAVKQLLEVDPSRLADPGKYIAVVNQLANNLGSVTKEGWNKAVELGTLEQTAKTAGDEIALQKARIAQQELIDELDSMEDTSSEVAEAKPTSEEKEAEQREQLLNLVKTVKPRLQPARNGFEDIHKTFSEATDSQLEKLSVDDLKAYVRKLDQIATNNDYSATADIASKLELIKDENKIPVINRTLGPLSKSFSTLATGLNYLLNQSKAAAAQFRAYTGIQDVVDGDTKASNHYQDKIAEPIQNLKNSIEFGSGWKKVLSKTLDLLPGYKQKVNLTSSENEDLSQTYTELNQRLEHLTPEQAFQNAKYNIENSIAKLRAIGNNEAADIKEKNYSNFSAASSLKEIREIMAKLHPEVKAWVEGVTKIWKDAGIDELAYNSLEKIEGEKPPMVDNYLPLATKSTDNQVSLDDAFQSRKEGILNNAERIGSLQSRQDLLGNTAYRSGSFLNNITQQAKDILSYVYTAPARVKINNFQKLNTKEGYKWTDGKEKTSKDFFEFLKDRIGDVKGMKMGELSNNIGSVTNILARTVYTHILGGPVQMIKQYAGIIPAIGEFLTKGNIGLIYGNGANSEGAKKVRKEHTIGGRFSNYAGLTTAFEAERSHTPNIGKIKDYFGKNIVNAEQLSTSASNTFVRSMFGKSDANLAERVWSGAYLAYLKQKGVDVSNTDNAFWEDQYKNRKNDLQKEAAAYAESYIGENYQHSNPVEAFSLAKRAPGIVRMAFPLVSYAINKADSMQKSIEVAATSPLGSKEQKEAIGNFSRNALEQASYAMISAFIAGAIKDWLTDLWRSSATTLDDPDEDDEERRKALRTKRALWDAAKSLSGPFFAATSSMWDYPVTDWLNHLVYDQYKEDGQSYTEWVESVNGKPIPNYKTGGVAETGIFGMIGKQAGLDKDWYVDGSELAWRDEQGNDHRKELTDDELSAFYGGFMKFLVGFGGSEALGAIEASERQAVRSAKSR